MTPRLEPIEKPDGPELQSHDQTMRQEFSTVLTRVKAVFARIPGTMERDRPFTEFRANCTRPR